MKTHKVVTIAICALSTLAFSFTLNPWKVQAQSSSEDGSYSYNRRARCTNETLKGLYGYIDQGFRGTQAPFTPFDAVRTSDFDGKGNFTGTGYLSQGGVIQQYTTNGTYNVNSDCTVTITNTLTFPDGTQSQPSTQFGVIVNGGKKVLQIQLTPGRNESGYYERSY